MSTLVALDNYGVIGLDVVVVAGRVRPRLRAAAGTRLGNEKMVGFRLLVLPSLGRVDKVLSNSCGRSCESAFADLCDLPLLRNMTLGVRSQSTFGGSRPDTTVCGVYQQAPSYGPPRELVISDDVCQPFSSHSPPRRVGHPADR